MHIIAKQGNVDNALTYEHICDTKEDMAKIQRKYVTLGSVCIVLQGENSAMEVYMADSNKEWHNIIVASGSGEGGSAAGLSLHICTSSEVSNGKPNISLPLEGVLYLVPSGNTTGNLYDEYVYVNNQWELFGGASIDLSGYATQNWVQQQGYLTTHQNISGKANSADLATVATSGSYNDLSNKPFIPTNISDLTNDAGYITDQDIDGKVDSEDLATVATSGSYNDLSDVPDIPTNLSDLTDDVGYFSSSTDIITVLDNNAYLNETNAASYFPVLDDGVTSADLENTLHGYDYQQAIEQNTHARLAFLYGNNGEVGIFSSEEFQLYGYFIKRSDFRDELVISSNEYPLLSYEDNGQGVEIGTVAADGTFTPLGILQPLNSNS